MNSFTVRRLQKTRIPQVQVKPVPKNPDQNEFSYIKMVTWKIRTRDLLSRPRPLVISDNILYCWVNRQYISRLETRILGGIWFSDSTYASEWIDFKATGIQFAPFVFLGRSSIVELNLKSYFVPAPRWPHAVKISLKTILLIRSTH